MSKKWIVKNELGEVVRHAYGKQENINLKEGETLEPDPPPIVEETNEE